VTVTADVSIRAKFTHHKSPPAAGLLLEGPPTLTPDGREIWFEVETIRAKAVTAKATTSIPGAAGAPSGASLLSARVQVAHYEGRTTVVFRLTPAQQGLVASASATPGAAVTLVSFVVDAIGRSGAASAKGQFGPVSIPLSGSGRQRVP
jgi:hypothetical protein